MVSAATAAAVLILNNTSATELRIRQDGDDALVTDADLGGASIKLTGVKADFDAIRLFSADTPVVSVIVFGYRAQS